MQFLKNIGLISRLSVSRKLMLIYALDLSAVIFISTILVNEKFIAIDFARKEILGNEYITLIREATSSLADTLQPIAPERVSTANARYAQIFADPDITQLSQALAEQLRTLSAKQQTPVQDELVTKALVTRIGNQSNLILDPDLDSYYTMSLVVLRFPELNNLLSQIRKKVLESETTAQDKTAVIQTDYLILEGRLDAIAQSVNADYSEAMQAGGPRLKTALGVSMSNLMAALSAFRDSARQQVFNPDQAAIVAGFASVSQELQQQLESAWSTAGVSLGELLQTRIDGLFKRMWLHLGTAATLLLLILSVVFYIASQIAVPVRRLAKIAENVRSSGDYTLRSDWRSADEIGVLVTAFNAMLEQLDQSRLIEMELTAQTRAGEAQRDMLEAMPIAMMVTSIPQHDVLHINAPAAGWIDGGSSDPWIRGLTPETRARFFQQLADTGAADEFEAVWKGQQSKNWVLLSARRLKYHGMDAVLTAFTPINRLKYMEQRLELWAKVFEASSESIMITDHKRRILTVNHAFCRSTAYELDELLGLLPNFLGSDHHPKGFYAEIWQAAELRGFWQGEMWLQRKTGESFPTWTLLNAVRNGKGEITHYIAASLDISERKANEQRISYLAQHDVLTDLPNRALCLDRLGMALQNAERLKRNVAVLFIDLDRFKNINDSLGHHIGDCLLRSVAQCLQQAVRAGDTVSRFAGDEFVVILNSVAELEEISQIVDKRLMPLLRQPHDVEGAELHISCSIGIAVYPQDGADIDTLLRNADTAMYQAKALGRNKAEFFTMDMDRRARERMVIENDLRVALERQEFQLFYQPRVACDSGELLGAEALIRWQHPEQGLISPARFIPIAEECGLIVQIGAWVLTEACRQLASWREQGFKDIVVSVNISAPQLREPGLLDILASALHMHQLNPALIELELTESQLMAHVTSTIELLHAIKKLGVSLSIDDFGTGYSSLNYLHRFPIDKLKIDQSFVSDMLEDPNDLAITKAIIGLGHTLGLRVVAEGVENKAEVATLSAAGCDELQGYFFGKPMPVALFAQWRLEYCCTNAYLNYASQQ